MSSRRFESEGTTPPVYGYLSNSSLLIHEQIQVLQTLTQWIMSYPERIRDKMIEQKDIEQTDWVNKFVNP